MTSSRLPNRLSLHVFLVLAASAVAQQPTMGPRKLVSYGPTDYPVNETAVAVDPLEPTRVVAMWNIDENVPLPGQQHWRIGYAYSLDGGLTWTDKDGNGALLLFPLPGECLTYVGGPADPQVVVDPESGRFVGTGLTECYEGCQTHALVHTARMEYGTQSFGNQILLHDGTGCGESYCCEPCFTDFPHTVVGQVPGQPGVYKQYIFGHSRERGEIGCGLSGAFNQLVLYSSDDGGVIWTPRARVLRGGQPVQGTFVAPAIGGNGRIYIAYTTPAMTVKVVKSDDGAQTFTDTALAQARTYAGAGLGTLIAGQISGTSLIMGCAVDPDLNDPNLDRVYVVYFDLAEPDSGGDGDLDVFLLRSFDGGATWSCPIRINNDTPPLPPDDVKADQYYAAVCVDDAGRAHVVWYDTRNDLKSPGEHVEIDLYYAEVSGQTGVPCQDIIFQNWNANAEAIDTAWLGGLGSFKLGDYISIAPIPSGAIAVYMGTNHPRIGFDFGGDKSDETIYSRRITWP